ncbi:MAG: sugar ABC transporter ATP-binding protein [Acidimicrobiales bacterium]
MGSSNSNLVELTDVHKRFGSVVALNGASVTLRPGEVRALIGGNGSGKSTLAKVLLGILDADEAQLAVEGVPYTTHGHGHRASSSVRIAGTFQEVSLLDDLSVAENLVLTKLPRRLGLLSNARANESTLREVLDRVLLPASILDHKVRDLPLDQRALAELAKVLLTDPRIVIMDELTASLRAEQVEQVGALLADLSARGVATLFVSHRLEEVQEFCTSCTVLRNGATALATDDITSHSMAEFVAAMTATGDTSGADRVRRGASLERGERVLEVSGLNVPGWQGSVTIEAHSGEIVGLGGLAGNGQTEALRAIFGSIPSHGASITVGSSDIASGSVRKAIRAGLGFLSGEREREMAFGQRSVDENLRIVAQGLRRSLGAADLLSRMKTKGAPADQMGSLSGGNQQKVIIGRWLGLVPKVLLADDPTRGVDVATREEIHKLLREFTAQGSAVVLTSSDDRELAEICDRIYVMYRGRVIAELTGDEVTEEDLGRVSIHPEYQGRAS